MLALPVFHQSSSSDPTLTDVSPVANERALEFLALHKLQQERAMWQNEKEQMRSFMESMERIHTVKLGLLQERLSTLQDELDQRSVKTQWIGNTEGNSNNAHPVSEEDDLPKLLPGNSEEVVTLRQTVSSLKEIMARKDERIAELEAENDQMSLKMQLQCYELESSQSESTPIAHNDLEQEMEARYETQILNLNGALSARKSYIESLEAQVRSQQFDGGYHKKQSTVMRVSHSDHRQLIKSFRSRVSRSFKSATSLAFPFPFMVRDNTSAIDIPVGAFSQENGPSMTINNRSSLGCLAIQLQEYDQEHTFPESPVSEFVDLKGFDVIHDTIHEVTGYSASDDSDDSEIDSLDIRSALDIPNAVSLDSAKPTKKRLSSFRNFLSTKHRSSKSKEHKRRKSLLKRANLKELQRLWRNNKTDSRIHDSMESWNGTMDDE